MSTIYSVGAVDSETYHPVVGRKQTQAILGFFFCPLFILACMSPMKIGPPPSDNLSVNMGEEFTLKKDQIAKLKGTSLEVEILKFYNEPCPPNVKCIWSGIGIEFEYRFDGRSKRGINLMKAFGYETSIIGSDYESYAVLKIMKS